MLKKMVVLAVVGFVGVAALGGIKKVRQDVHAWCEKNLNGKDEKKDDKDSLTQKDIERLKKDLKELDKDVIGTINQLAKERVEVADLEKQVQELEKKQEADKALLDSRAAAIKRATEIKNSPEPGMVVFGTRKLSVPEALAELESGVARYKSNEKSLTSLKTLLVQRQRVRDALEKQLEALKNQKAELTNAVNALEAELALLKLQQTESKYQTDDTKLAKLKENIRAAEKKLAIEREKMKLMPAALEPNAPAASNKSVDDIMAPLNGQPAPAKPAGKPDAPKTGAQPIDPAD
jgi:chromosome segregation ATPase